MNCSHMGTLGTSIYICMSHVGWFMPMMTKFLYLKNKVVSLIYKIWPGMEGKKTYSWNEVIYLLMYIYFYRFLWYTSKQTAPLSWWRLTPHFLHFNLVFRLQTTHLPWSSGPDSWSDLSILISTDNSLAIVLSRFILVWSTDLINTMVMQLWNSKCVILLLGFALWNNRQAATTVTFTMFTKRENHHVFIVVTGR